MSGLRACDRAALVKSALEWLSMARDVAKEVDNWRSGHIVQRIDRAVERLSEALDIAPSEAAIEAVVAEQQPDQERAA